jgi:hypothetical protein
MGEEKLRLIGPTFGLFILTAASLCAAATAAASTPASRECAAQSAQQHLIGKAATDFKAKCMKGPQASTRPLAPSGPGKEAHAVTEPSGVNRNVRSGQCTAQADKRGLHGQARKQFQLSCMATAGPVTEGETQTQTPKPAKAIPGIGVNTPPHP